MSTNMIIEYEGPNDILVWKHPVEDFTTGTKVIVRPSQEAIFVMNGQALDLLPPGDHVLETEKIPLLSRLFGLRKGAEMPFRCEVYYINRTVSMEIQWGTVPPMTMRDPEFDIDVTVRANGTMNLAVNNSRKLLVKLAGTVPMLTVDTLKSYFKGVLMMYVKDMLANTMINNRIGVSSVSTRLVEMSTLIHQQLIPIFFDYGMDMPIFTLNSVSSPSDDKGYQMILEAKAKQKIREIEGVSKTDEMNHEYDMKFGGKHMQNMQQNMYNQPVYPQQMPGQPMYNQQPQYGQPMYNQQGMYGQPMYNQQQPMYGQPLVYNPQPQNYQQMTFNVMPCPYCGKPVPVGSLYCCWDGQPLQQF